MNIELVDNTRVIQNNKILIQNIFYIYYNEFYKSLDINEFFLLINDINAILDNKTKSNYTFNELVKFIELALNNYVHVVKYNHLEHINKRLFNNSIKQLEKENKELSKYNIIKTFKSKLFNIEKYQDLYIYYLHESEEYIEYKEFLLLNKYELIQDLKNKAIDLNASDEVLIYAK